MMGGYGGYVNMELDNVTVPSSHCSDLYHGNWIKHNEPSMCAWGASITGPQLIFTMKDTVVANTWDAAMGSAGIKHKRYFKKSIRRLH